MDLISGSRRKKQFVTPTLLALSHSIREPSYERKQNTISTRTQKQSSRSQTEVFGFTRNNFFPLTVCGEQVRLR